MLSVRIRLSSLRAIAAAALSGLPPQELDPLLASLVRKEVLSLHADPRSPELAGGQVQEVAERTLDEPPAPPPGNPIKVGRP